VISLAVNGCLDFDLFCYDLYLIHLEMSFSPHSDAGLFQTPSRSFLVEQPQSVGTANNQDLNNMSLATNTDHAALNNSLFQNSVLSSPQWFLSPHSSYDEFVRLNSPIVANNPNHRKSMKDLIKEQQNLVNERSLLKQKSLAQSDVSIASISVASVPSALAQERQKLRQRHAELTASDHNMHKNSKDNGNHSIDSPTSKLLFSPLSNQQNNAVNIANSLNSPIALPEIEKSPLSPLFSPIPSLNPTENKLLSPSSASPAPLHAAKLSKSPEIAREKAAKFNNSQGNRASAMGKSTKISLSAFNLRLKAARRIQIWWRWRNAVKRARNVRKIMRAKIEAEAAEKKRAEDEAALRAKLEELRQQLAAEEQHKEAPAIPNNSLAKVKEKAKKLLISHKSAPYFFQQSLRQNEEGNAAKLAWNSSPKAEKLRALKSSNKKTPRLSLSRSNSSLLSNGRSGNSNNNNNNNNSGDGDASAGHGRLQAYLKGFMVRNIWNQKVTQNLIKQIKDVGDMIRALQADTSSSATNEQFQAQLTAQLHTLKDRLLHFFDNEQRKQLVFQHELFSAAENNPPQFKQRHKVERILRSSHAVSSHKRDSPEKFHNNADYRHFAVEMPQTARPSTSDSVHSNFLKRKSQKVKPQKINWDAVRPKTTSGLSQAARNSRFQQQQQLKQLEALEQQRRQMEYEKQLETERLAYHIALQSRKPGDITARNKHKNQVIIKAAKLDLSKVKSRIDMSNPYRSSGGEQLSDEEEGNYSEEESQDYEDEPEEEIKGELSTEDLAALKSLQTALQRQSLSSPKALNLQSKPAEVNDASLNQAIAEVEKSLAEMHDIQQFKKQHKTANNLLSRSQDMNHDSNNNHHQSTAERSVDDEFLLSSHPSTRRVVNKPKKNLGLTAMLHELEADVDSYMQSAREKKSAPAAASHLPSAKLNNKLKVSRV
jgi:hypothetical protein